MRCQYPGCTIEPVKPNYVRSRLCHAHYNDTNRLVSTGRLTLDADASWSAAHLQVLTYGCEAEGCLERGTVGHSCRCGGPAGCVMDGEHLCDDCYENVARNEICGECGIEEACVVVYAYGDHLCDTCWQWRESKARRTQVAEELRAPGANKYRMDNGFIDDEAVARDVLKELSDNNDETCVGELIASK